jgi:glucose/arabinose dehydrogenase
LVAVSLTSLASAQTVVDPQLTVSAVVPVGTLALPTQIRFIGANHFLVAEKNTGRVLRVQNGVVSGTTALDLNVANDGERGLLGLELDPNFPATLFVYLYYSSTTGSDGGAWLDNRLSRFTWNGSTLGSEVVLMTFGSAADGLGNGPDHDAGPILFGPDNLLYGTTGDLLRNFAEQNNQSQATVSALVGGIYRLNSNGTIPVSNPFASNPNSDFRPWFAYGVRNTFGIAFDPLTGNLWDTENGPETYDEINLIAAGTNSGWTKIMGPDSRDPEGVGDLVQLPGSFYSDPEFSFFDTNAPTGLAFLANSNLDAGYRDALLVGDSNNGNLYLFRLNASRTGFALTGDLADLVADNTVEQNQVRFGQDFGSITDIQIGPDTRVYVTSLGNGTVYKIVPEPSTTAMLLVGSLAVALGRWGGRAVADQACRKLREILASSPRPRRAVKPSDALRINDGAALRQGRRVPCSTAAATPARGRA